MRTQNGYWWAISIQQQDGRPEIIDVNGDIATRVSDSWHYNIIEFDLLQLVDTSHWPKDGSVDRKTVYEGYWWAFDPTEEVHTIVLVGEHHAVQDFDGDIARSLEDFDFRMPIDTSGWPKE